MRNENQVEGRFPILTWWERLMSWINSKERLQAEIKRYKARLLAMMSAKDEALSNALLFENQDITSWLQEISSKGTGALGVRIKELEDAVKEQDARLLEAGPSEARAWKTVDAILEAWEHSAGLQTANWNKEKKEWVPVIRNPMLPQEVCDAIRAWLNRPTT